MAGYSQLMTGYVFPPAARHSKTQTLNQNVQGGNLSEALE